MQEMTDKYRSLKLDMGQKIKVRDLLMQTCNPASFYLLPKVHKTFTKFPPGRPISSTCKSRNRNISAVVDFILKPIMCTLPGSLLDTTHFLHILQNIELDVNKKYLLITCDIDSMYTNLNVNRCKYFCMKGFRKYKANNTLPFEINEQTMHSLLNISLDYNYLEYDNEFFVQHKSIQMGNCASVSIANFTAYHELKKMFVNRPEIKLNVRFVDDGFMVVECTTIENLDSWTKEVFKHEYLTFTVQSSPIELNFLDVNVKITNDNESQTSLYKKPMNKCMYLSFYSNHLLHSLPFSQGIRLKPICFETNECNEEIHKMLVNFEKRGYPKEILEKCMYKLNNLKRYDLLKPKSEYLIHNLCIYYPEILLKYGIEISNRGMHMNIDNTKENHDFYVVVPFYNNVYRLRQIVKNFLNEEISQHTNPMIKHILQSMEIHVVFSVTNKLEFKLKM
ncbi:unnamed protein product [Orchesella dallaii]|uniref:Reverse transcriptase domain-containing protein n=1 Tax=Orchesella dallaii TaxID=48710 RepID=A0ABP1RUU9_9HEXA